MTTTSKVARYQNHKPLYAAALTALLMMAVAVAPAKAHADGAETAAAVLIGAALLYAATDDYKDDRHRDRKVYYRDGRKYYHNDAYYGGKHRYHKDNGRHLGHYKNKHKQYYKKHDDRRYSYRGRDDRHDRYDGRRDRYQNHQGSVRYRH